jgi:hypothetical protein
VPAFMFELTMLSGTEMKARVLAHVQGGGPFIAPVKASPIRRLLPVFHLLPRVLVHAEARRSLDQQARPARDNGEARTQDVTRRISKHVYLPSHPSPPPSGNGVGVFDSDHIAAGAHHEAPETRT